LQFSSHALPVNNDRVIKTALMRGGTALSFADVVTLWRTDPSFCGFFNQVLADAPFAAYFWETPPFTRDTVNRQFEFVTVDSPQLAGVQADAVTFAKFFAAAAPASVAVFPNISRDALLVAPCPVAPLAAYPHLAAFARSAPEQQRREFWRQVGEAVGRRLSDRALWVSTSGMGVYWLHVRLDSRPKYYNWRPYTVLE